MRIKVINDPDKQGYPKIVDEDGIIYDVDPKTGQPK